MSSYCFPILNSKDCVSYLKAISVDCDINDQDFTAPTRLRWHKYYTVILCSCCMDLTPDMLAQGQVTSDVTHPELHEDSTTLVTVFKGVQALMSSCGMTEFNLDDILAPKKQRLLRICSAFINYHRFQEERYEVCNDLKTQNEALQDQRETLIRENEESKQRINTIKGHQAETEVEVQAIQVKIDEWTNKMAEKHQEAANLQQQSTENKTAVSEAKANITKTKERVLAMKTENTKLSAKIVPSPDRMKGEMDRMERKLTQDRHSKENLNTRLSECRKRFTLQQQRDQEIDHSVPSLDMFSQQMEKHRLEMEKINNTQEELSNTRTDIKQLDSKTQQLTRQISIKQEKLEKLTMQHNMRMEDRAATRDQILGDLSNQEQHRGEQYERTKHVTSEIQLVKDRIQEDSVKHQGTMRTLSEKYHEMLMELDNYHAYLGKAYQTYKDGSGDI